jgi:hypothetical protein
MDEKLPPRAVGAWNLGVEAGRGERGDQWTRDVREISEASGA